jgi:hypothetical protein
VLGAGLAGQLGDARRELLVQGRAADLQRLDVAADPVLQLFIHLNLI